MSAPTLAAWLPAALPALNVAIVRRALECVGIEELRHNGSGVIDDWNRRAGAPLGSPWCASFVTAVLEDCGAAVPRSGRASCDVLMSWGRNRGLWLGPRARPPEGALVLYGRDITDATHVGLVARVLPGGELRSVEGNTSYAGFSREGVAVIYKPVSMGRVLGFIPPTPAT